MESRKVQLTGGATYIVSLPKSWVKENGISAGDIIWISNLSDGSLLLSQKGREGKTSKKKVLEVNDENTDHLMRKLIGMYIAGFDTIEIRSKKIDTKSRKAIMEFTRMVVGPEIIDETAKYVILQDLINPVEFSQQKGLKRMYMLVKSMHNDAVTALINRDKTLALDVIQRDGEVDRLHWMIAKQYNLILNDRAVAKDIGVSGPQSLNLMLISRIVERIGDHTCNIAESVALLDGTAIDDKLLKEIANESDISLRILEKSVNAFFSKNLEEANDAIDLSGKLNRASDSLTKKIKNLDGDILVPLTSIIESARRIGMYATDISEIAINYIYSVG